MTYKNDYRKVFARFYIEKFHRNFPSNSFKNRYNLDIVAFSTYVVHVAYLTQRKVEISQGLEYRRNGLKKHVNRKESRTWKARTKFYVCSNYLRTRKDASCFEKLESYARRLRHARPCDFRSSRVRTSTLNGNS